MTKIEFDFIVALKRVEKKHDGIESFAEYRETYKSVRSMSYQLIALALALAYRLQEEPAMFEDFAKHKFWEGASKFSSKKALSHALMFLYGSHREPEASRARRHAKALETYFDDNLEPSHVPAHIKKYGGLEALYKNRLKGGNDDGKTAEKWPEKYRAAKNVTSSKDDAVAPASSSDLEVDLDEEFDEQSDIMSKAQKLAIEAKYLLIDPGDIRLADILTLEAGRHWLLVNIEEVGELDFVNITCLRTRPAT